MIAEGEEFADLISNDLFLHRVIDFGCGDGRLAGLFDRENYNGVDIRPGIIELAGFKNPGYHFALIYPFQPIIGHDAIFAHDVFRSQSTDFIARIWESFSQPRLVITEFGGDRGPMFYSGFAKDCGYRLHRCIFVKSPLGDITFMDFHRSESDDQIPEHGAS